ncbi:hydroxymethylglutaryl-CoA reductase [Hugenholtzia roseola]|uniref:hydroxymethylglutaryl-CoA reductase n=1 Tax=Hugenholtzia roseola TaxID=1002 RepID=UPI000411F502|nr:hydroxymethylglutaryl-CoA reductase [Hugenholtzia roseola]
MEIISGFSKLSKEEKMRWVLRQFADNPAQTEAEWKSFWHQDPDMQKLFDEFSENTLTNFYMPFGVIPNLLLNGELLCVPMVIEESSVVAAAGKAAKYWQSRGGFKAQVIDVKKVGQVHFLWKGEYNKLYCVFDELKEALLDQAAALTQNMRKRGGGILDLELVDMRHVLPDYYQIKATFDTCDSMGANFINSCLEQFAKTLQNWITANAMFDDSERDVTIVMCILSNYTPDCLVRVWVESPIEALTEIEGMSPQTFAFKFKTAVEIAKNDVFRATTHNKGIFNGIDAIILATGNDFRAVEACGHAYAARHGRYTSLTDCSIENGIFKFWIDIPMAVGTVGGLTALHPLAKKSLDMLGNPSAQKLMQIAATVGLAQNFAAVKSLTTTGIQKGHMKMHLLNILRTFEANDEEIKVAVEHFKTNVVSFNAVRELMEQIRQDKYIAE